MITNSFLINQRLCNSITQETAWFCWRLHSFTPSRSWTGGRTGKGFNCVDTYCTGANREARLPPCWRVRGQICGAAGATSKGVQGVKGKGASHRLISYQCVNHLPTQSKPVCLKATVNRAQLGHEDFEAFVRPRIKLARTYSCLC